MNRVTIQQINDATLELKTRIENELQTPCEVVLVNDAIEGIDCDPTQTVLKFERKGVKFLAGADTIYGKIAFIMHPEGQPFHRDLGVDYAPMDAVIEVLENM